MRTLVKSMAAAALVALAVCPQLAAAADLGGTGTVGTPAWRKHIYVFHPGMKSLVTYSTLKGTIEVHGLQTMGFGADPTIKDRAGNACYRLTVGPWPGVNSTIHWEDTLGTNGGAGDEHDLVLGNRVVVICDEQLPNHSQLPYPPD